MSRSRVDMERQDAPSGIGYRDRYAPPSFGANHASASHRAPAEPAARTADGVETAVPLHCHRYSKALNRAGLCLYLPAIAALFGILLLSGGL